MKPTLKYGYAGKTCRVNLTKHEIKIEESEKYIKKFVGGPGVGVSILFDELNPNTEALDPENIMVFSTGPLTGTLAPISGRLEIDSKNVLTGGIGTTNVGGHFGAELKYAGFDFIIVCGKSDKPVYLEIIDGRVEIKDASFLWGKTTWETEDILTEKDKRTRVLCIGPAGENQVSSACIIVNKKHAAGRCGIGAIMGAKNLKAISARGTGSVAIANPKEFFKALDEINNMFNKSKAITKKYRTTLGTHGGTERVNDACGLPYRNFQDDHWPDGKLDKVGWKVFDKWRTRKIADFCCPLYMSSYLELPDENIHTEGFEQNHAWDYMGKLDMNDPVGILKTHILCNSLGLDIDNSSGVIGFAIELFEKGIITEKDTDGLKLSWGDTGTIIELIKKLAYKKGFGKILSLGVKRASEIIGKSSEKFAIHVKGQELAEAVRSAKGWALGVITAPRGGGHLCGATLTEYQKVSEEISLEKFGYRNAGKQTVYDGKAKVVVWFERLKQIVDMCGIGWHSSCWVEQGLCEIKHYAKLYSSAVGKEMGEAQFAKMGEQLINLEKAFNTIHAGFERKDDFPPKRLMEEPIKTGKYKGEILDPLEWGNMLDQYYDLHNWDRKTGLQTRKCLENLDMANIVKVLKKEGKLLE